MLVVYAVISDLQKNDIEIEYYTTINLSNLHKKLDGWIIRNFQMLIKSLRMNFTMTQNFFMFIYNVKQNYYRISQLFRYFEQQQFSQYK